MYVQCITERSPVLTIMPRQAIIGPYKDGYVTTVLSDATPPKNPSWLYTVLMGATTMWERWDSMLPDGRVNPGEMTSFNHYALGAVGDWMHRVRESSH